MLIPNDWDGITTKCYVIEWPDSTLYQAILVGLIGNVTRGRFWDAKTGTVTDAQAIGVQFYNQFNAINNLGGNNPMGCFEDLASKLDCICLALQNLSLATPTSGSAGAGTFEAVPSPFVDDGLTPPDGYEDYAEYEQWKCDLAQYVINKMIVDVTQATIWDIALLTLSELVIPIALTFLTPIPFDEILAMAGALIAVVVTVGSATAVLEQCVDYLENIDLCLLFSAADVSEAIENVEADIDSQSFAVQDGNTKTILKALFNNNSLNILFEEKPPLMDLPTGDCSGCGPTGDFFWHLFTPPGQSGSWGTLERTGQHYSCASQFGNGFHRLNLYCEQYPSGSGRCSTMTNFALSGITYAPTPDSVIWPCGGSGYSTLPEPFDETDIGCANQLIIASPTAFTLEFDAVYCEA